MDSKKFEKNNNKKIWNVEINEEESFLFKLENNAYCLFFRARSMQKMGILSDILWV